MCVCGHLAHDVPIVGHLGIIKSKVGCYSGTAGDVADCFWSCDVYQICCKISVGLKLCGAYNLFQR